MISKISAPPHPRACNSGIRNVTEMETCGFCPPRTLFSTGEWHPLHSHGSDGLGIIMIHGTHPPNLLLPQKPAGGASRTLLSRPPTTVIGQRQEQDPIRILPLVHILMLKERSCFFFFFYWGFCGGNMCISGNLAPLFKRAHPQNETNTQWKSEQEWRKNLEPQKHFLSSWIQLCLKPTISGLPSHLCEPINSDLGSSHLLDSVTYSQKSTD